jgi:hypothetical protein
LTLMQRHFFGARSFQGNAKSAECAIWRNDMPANTCATKACLQHQSRNYTALANSEEG